MREEIEETTERKIDLLEETDKRETLVVVREDVEEIEIDCYDN